MRGLLALALCLFCPLVASAQHGIYFDYHNPSANKPKHIDHPHLDGVFLRFSWKELEPEKGQYTFEPIEKMIAPWVKARRRIILGIKPAGQRNEDTPDWVYQTVKPITYERNGIQVKVPKYWHKKYNDQQKGLIYRLGQKYNFDDRIEGFMIGIAHLGFITACPNKNGSFAFLDAGWTPRRWERHVFKTVDLYKKHLWRKFVFINGEELILKIKDPPGEGFPKSKRYFVDVRDSIFNRMVNEKNGSVASNGLEADADAFLATGIPALYDSYRDKATAGKISLAIHDDWPLWVPADKRVGVNAGKDNEYFLRALQNGIGGIRGIPKTNIIWMKLLDTDLQCTDPRHENYEVECEGTLIGFKNSLLK